MGCEPWLSPGRDCARSAARHGVLLGVRVRQLRATGAPQSEKNRTLRGSAAYLPTSLVCPKIAHPALSHGVPQVRTRSERIACVSWLSPCRDCARSAARHGFLWVSTSDSSAPQALRNRLKKIARSAALLHICRLRWCVRKSRILRLLCEGERNGKLKMGKIRLGLIGFAEEAVGGDYGDGGGVVAGSKAEVEALAEEHLRKGGFATEAVDDPWLGGA